MDNVTRLPTRARLLEQPEGLTSAHRCLMYSIMDLCINVSLQTGYTAEYRYAGGTHSLSVDVVPPEHQATQDGGDGTFRACWYARVWLPPREIRETDTLHQLAEIITYLQRYLPAEPTPGGAA